MGVLAQREVYRALLAGALYALFYALASQVAWLIRGVAQRRRSAFAIRLRKWGGWAILLRGGSLVLALGYPYLMVLTNTFSASDVGLAVGQWQTILARGVALAVGFAAWLALLWWLHLRRVPAEAEVQTAQEDPPQVPRPSDRRSLPRLVLNALRHEAANATFRGALMPAVGQYAGIWLAPLAKMLLTRANPAALAGLAKQGEREYIHLDWALDWISAVVFAYTGAAWAASAGRLLCRAAVLLLADRAVSRVSAPEDSRPAK